MTTNNQNNTNGSRYNENEFGELLGNYTQKANLSQVQLAEQIGVSRRTVVAWMGGEYGPSEKNTYQLIQFFVAKGILVEPKEAESFWNLACSKQQGKSYKEAFNHNWFQQVLTKPRPSSNSQSSVILPNWAVALDIAQGVSEQRAGELLARYQQEKPLYLQRETARKAFEDFLASDKTLFLLLGKAGVGKSFFFLSLTADNLIEKKYCRVLYNAAKLDQSEAFQEVLLKDWCYQLRVLYPELAETNSPTSFEELLGWVARLGGDEQCRLILFVDAVNENDKALDLLRQLNQLADIAAPYPWFKIVLSSRPEAWRTLKGRVRLSDHRFYRLPGQPEVGVELEPFSLGLELQIFGREELPQVYANYYQVYELQTKYEELSPELRLTLRDPLTLKLVASIYQRKLVPAKIQPGQLYQQYAEQLISDGRLREVDLAFLEKELMPLIIKEGHYTKAITIQQVQATNTAMGKPLYELILLDELQTDGRWTNQAYRNLVDSEILVRRGTTLDYEIGFKYERFYDYYAGKQLYKLAQTTIDKPKFYRNLIEQIRQKPFLWGTVKNALVNEVEQTEVSLLWELSAIEEQEQIVKQLSVQVLVSLGELNLSQSGIFLTNLLKLAGLGQVYNRPKLVSRKHFKETVSSSDKQARRAREVAIEVAGELGLSELLKLLILDTQIEVRQLAVRATYYMWQQHPQASFEVLEYVAHKVRLKPGLDPAVLDAFINLVGVFFSKHSQNPAVTGRLREICQLVIANNLLSPENSRLWSKWIAFLKRKALVELGSRLLVKWMSVLPAYNVYNMTDVAAIFSCTHEEKELFRRIVAYIDIRGDYDKVQVEQDFRAALSVNARMMESILTFALAVRTSTAASEYVPMVVKLFEYARTELPLNMYVNGLPTALSFAVEYNLKADEYFANFERIVEESQIYQLDHPKIPGVEFEYPLSETPHLAKYLLFQYRREGHLKTEWLNKRIDKALAQNNLLFFQHLVLSELVLVGIDWGSPGIALETLGLFLKSATSEIEDVVQSFLARLSLYYPDEVELFLEEQAVAEEFKLQVHLRKPTEPIGLIIGSNLYYFCLNDVILKTDPLLEHLIAIAQKMADCKNLNEWLHYLITYLINLIYGNPVL